jgi:formamidopyrimidine-DNA glycosylase
VTRTNLPEKRRLIIDFDDDPCLSVNFWWFGYAHWTPQLADHKMIVELGPSALDLNLTEFRSLLKGRRGAIKPFLLNQKHIAGFGNVTIQDPLFRARIHPMRPINSLSVDEVDALYAELQHTLHQAIDLGGSSWELNLYGEKGRWDLNFFDVGYKEDQPCPVCRTAIHKIKTGSTSGYICPQCQSV